MVRSILDTVASGDHGDSAHEPADVHSEKFNFGRSIAYKLQPAVSSLLFAGICGRLRLRNFLEKLAWPPVRPNSTFASTICVVFTIPRSVAEIPANVGQFPPSAPRPAEFRNPHWRARAWTIIRKRSLSMAFVITEP